MTKQEIEVDENTLRQIDELADAMDRSRSWLVNDALTHYLDEVGPWVRKVREGMAELDRGEGIPHEQVMAEMRKKIAARQP
jgi:predicted transcriptional regulator